MRLIKYKIKYLKDISQHSVIANHVLQSQYSLTEHKNSEPRIVVYVSTMY